MEFVNLDCPFNFTSIGQTSYNVFKELKDKANICLFSTSNNKDIRCFEPSQEEILAVKGSLENSRENYSRDNKSLMIFHIAGSEKSLGRRQSLMTWHETSELTPYEINTLNQKDVIFVSSRYTEGVFKSALSGPKVVYAPLGFDSSSFSRLEKTDDGVVTFGLRGKLEARKNTLRVMKAWVKVFGGDPRYRLDCSIFNAFYSKEEQTKIIMDALPDKTLPWNVNILPFVESNKAFNKVLNNADIDLTGMSGGEGFNLPLFQSLCLGKQCVVLNAHVHKDYCTPENSILVEPNGRVDAIDGKFFIEGAHTNQGEWHDFKEDDLIDAMIKAAARGKERNTEGEKLQSWTYQNTAKIILDNL